MNRHLHVFKKHQDAVAAFYANEPEEYDMIWHSRLRVQTGNDEQWYAAVPNMRVAHNFAGNEFVSMQFHYEPDPKVREYLESRIRWPRTGIKL